MRYEWEDKWGKVLVEEVGAEKIKITVVDFDSPLTDTMYLFKDDIIKLYELFCK